jgi:hypothetical protein
MSWFYDDADFDSGPIREIERIYCFRFDSFSESNWETLGLIYDKLPSQQIPSSVPYWFGTEATGNYLWASVEPHGLQIAGTLREEDWLAWEAVFNAQVQASSLPRYEIEMQ